MPFEFHRLSIPDVILVEPKKFSDTRGYFLETYKKKDFEDFGINQDFVQTNHSRSSRNVLRGLHYQNPPADQGKLVRTVTGRVFDVAVDIRESSPTYGEWVGEELSEENSRMLYIPPGFAHGFCVLGKSAHFEYHVTDYYAPESEAGIRWNDPEIGVNWPIDDPVLSEKDKALPGFSEADNGFD